MQHPRNLISSTVVMEFFGFKCRTGFWEFVGKKGVPHIRLSSRKIMFDPVALNQWIAKRNTSTKPRQFEFTEEVNREAPTHVYWY